MDEILKSLSIPNDLQEAADQAASRLAAQKARVERLQPNNGSCSIEYSILLVLQRIADHANDRLKESQSVPP